jgi:hypothetical protein
MMIDQRGGRSIPQSIKSGQRCANCDPVLEAGIPREVKWQCRAGRPGIARQPKNAAQTRAEGLVGRCAMAETIICPPMPEYIRPREKKVLIEEDEQGRKRWVTATRGHPNQPGHWDLEYVQPDGLRKTDRINGNDRIVTIKMENMMDDNRREFIQARARGDRPAQNMQFDRNVPVSDLDPEVYKR